MTNMNKRNGLILLIIFALMILTVWFAPDEKTMGAGIKPVYVHVALTWAGMLGLVSAGVLGLVVLVRNRQNWHDWMETIFWVSLIYFILGVVVSFVAAKVNWGAIDLQEPRTVAGLQFSAIALIVKIVGGWFPWNRLRALLNVLLLAVLWWTTTSAPLVLHPAQPVRDSGSASIQFEFALLTGLMILAGVQIVSSIYRMNKNR